MPKQLKINRDYQDFEAHDYPLYVTEDTCGNWKAILFINFIDGDIRVENHYLPGLFCRELDGDMITHRLPMELSKSQIDDLMEYVQDDANDLYTKWLNDEEESEEYREQKNVFSENLEHYCNNICLDSIYDDWKEYFGDADLEEIFAWTGNTLTGVFLNAHSDAICLASKDDLANHIKDLFLEHYDQAFLGDTVGELIQKEGGIFRMKEKYIKARLETKSVSICEDGFVVNGKKIKFGDWLHNADLDLREEYRTVELLRFLETRLIFNGSQYTEDLKTQYNLDLSKLSTLSQLEEEYRQVAKDHRFKTVDIDVDDEEVHLCFPETGEDDSDDPTHYLHHGGMIRIGFEIDQDLSSSKPTLPSIKQEAYQLKKSKGIAHNQALEQVAKKHGYSSYHECQKVLK